MATPRNDARSLILSSKKPKFEVVEFEGQKFALKVPSAKERGEIVMRSTSIKEDGRAVTDNTLQTTLALIASLYTLGDDGQPAERVLEDADVAALLEQPVSAAVVDALGSKARFMMFGVDPTEALNLAKKG